MYYYYYIIIIIIMIIIIIIIIRKLFLGQPQKWAHTISVLISSELKQQDQTNFL